MSIIRIFANDIELNFKKDSLTLKKENNALSQDFKVTHSSFPFLIIEDESCKKALGSADITSTSKRKVIPVTVIEFGVKFYGELQQISVQKGYRKCNLKYSSDLLLIMNKKISEFMPIVSVIPGETNPVPYTEETNGFVAGSENWETFPVSMIGQIYPNVKFQFPTIYWRNKFGVDLDSDDEWYNYKNHLNLFSEDFSTFLINNNQVVGENVIYNNVNVPKPHVFLLSPLYYIFSFLNWKISGDFISHVLITRLLIDSKKDNLSKSYVVIQEEENIYLSTLGGPYGSLGLYQSNIYLTSTIPTRHSFTISFSEPNFSNSNPDIQNRSFTVFHEGVLIYRYDHPKNTPSNVYQSSFYVDVDPVNQYGSPIVFSYITDINTLPTYSITHSAIALDRTYSQMHPTIELGRYVPDWTVGNYLNYLKNQFNLDITLDDFKKTATFNLNESLANSETPEILDKSLVLKSFELAANSSFVLKYENSEDEALFITRDEVVLYDNQDDDFTKKIETKFKIVPRNGYTSELSEALEDKDGVGLMIYEPVNAPYTSETTINGFNLSIPGTKGIYETFFRRWLKFRLTASRVELEGQFTEIEISKIYKAKSIYIDNQRYRIESLEYNETTNNYYDLKMKLESVNY